MMRKLSIGWLCGAVATLALSRTTPAHAEDSPPAPATAAEATASQITGVVHDLLGKPVAGASVHVVAVPGGGSRTVQTDGNGRYLVELAEPGTYSLVVAARGAQTSRRVVVAAGAALEASFDLSLAAGSEVIEIEGMVTPAVPPVPVKDARLIPPYSDAAITSDVWARAWFLLDIDRRGVVTRVKLLKSPGFDLDRTAIKHAFGLGFTPARNADDTPVSTYVLWSMEWPSVWWLATFDLPATRLPAHDIDVLDPGRPAIVKVPCANSGAPLQFESAYPIYRDCAGPDFERLRNGPWIYPEDLTRTVGGAPIALDKLAFGTLGRPTPPPPPRPARSRIAPITTTAITGGLLAATAFAFYRWSSIQADVREVQWATAGESHAKWLDATDRAQHWRNLTWAGIGATFVGTAVSAFLWNRHDRPLITAAPVERGAGASVSLGGSF